jgi:hypothetical protein
MKIEICTEEEKQQAIIDLLSLPFISKYRLLLWTGTADGTLLTPRFNINDLLNRYMVIKSFKIVPYYIDNSEDLYLDDGAGTVFTETIRADLRINRIFDAFSVGTVVILRINDAVADMFGNDGSGVSYPIDISEDNIYYKYPEKINQLSLAITADVTDTLNGAVNYQNPAVKVTMGVYLI